MSSPLFVPVPALPALRDRLNARNTLSSITPHCSQPTLSDLQRLGALTVLHRPADYMPDLPSARSQVEPEVIALVGVSHQPSPLNRSATFATAAIEALKPDAVVLELCRLRAPLLNEPPKPDSLPRWTRAALGKRLLGTLLAPTESKNIAAGEEFRAAAKAAEMVGATLVLGDRPLGHTLGRAWRSLDIRDRFMLAGALVRVVLRGKGATDLSDEALRETVLSGVDAEGVVEKYVDLLGERFPGLRKTLVDERDLYMAWVLKRSRAVSGKKCVVGVIGKAHVDGVAKALRKDERRKRKGEKPLLLFRDIVV